MARFLVRQILKDASSVTWNNVFTDIRPICAVSEGQQDAWEAVKPKPASAAEQSGYAGSGERLLKA
jgi:hypothetical protein